MGKNSPSIEEGPVHAVHMRGKDKPPALTLPLVSAVSQHELVRIVQIPLMFLATVFDHVLQILEPLRTESTSMSCDHTSAVISLLMPAKTELTCKMSWTLRALQFATLDTSSHSLACRSSFMLSMVVFVQERTTTN